jgi:hypothetical protein
MEAVIIRPGNLRPLNDHLPLDALHSAGTDTNDLRHLQDAISGAKLGMARSRPSRRTIEPISPSVCPSARRNSLIAPVGGYLQTHTEL